MKETSFNKLQFARTLRRINKRLKAIKKVYLRAKDKHCKQALSSEITEFQGLANWINRFLEK